MGKIFLTMCELGANCDPWLLCVADKKSKPVQLVYETPQEVQNLSRITMEINAQHCKQLWNS